MIFIDFFIFQWKEETAKLLYRFWSSGGTERKETRVKDEISSGVLVGGNSCNGSSQRFHAHQPEKKRSADNKGAI